mgnify:FL=1|jgi:hypothetical protein
MPHYLILFYFILLDLTEPVHAQHNMIWSDHRKDSPKANQPILCRGTYAVVGTETHLVVNSNVADKIIYLHGPINSSSHTLP